MFGNGLFCRVFGIAACGLASAASAQDFSGALSFGIGSVSVEDLDGDLTTKSLDATFAADFGNGITLDGDLSVQALDVGGFVGEVQTTLYSIDAAYRFGGGVTVGAYAQGIEVDQFRDLDFTSQGVTLGFEADRWGIEAFYGRTGFGDLPVEATDYGVTGWARPNDRLTLGASVIHSAIETTDRDPTLVRVAGVFDLSDSLVVFAGGDALSLDATDVYTVGVGLGLDLKRVIGLPAILSVEGTYQRVDRMKVEGVELALTIPLGRAATRVPPGSVAGHVLRAKRSALNGLYDTGVPLF